jgi:hypothetical protein
MGTKIYLRSYPKAVFLYPLFIATLIILPIQWTDTEYGFWSNLFGISRIQMSNYLGLIWLIFLLFCFFVISIEVKLSKFCAVIFAIITISVLLIFSPLGGAFIGFITNTLNLDLGLPFFFYISVLVILAFTLGCMIVGAHIEYVKIERNEIWCMKGITGKSKERFPTRSLEINVERPDFLEYWLGTGRVILKIPSLNKFIQLDTVFRAGTKVRKIDILLSAIKVDESGTPITET